MRINTNIASLQAQTQLQKTTRALSRALERLASGKRINSARDDASGLAIASGLEATRRALQQGIRNLNDAQSLLYTADSALETQTEIVQRMRELATQSANGIISVSDRQNLEGEFQTLYAEFSRVATQSNFNGVKLFDGSFATQSIQVGAQAGQSIGLNLTSGLVSDVFKASVGSGAFTLSSSLSYGGDTGFLRDLNRDGKLDWFSVSSTNVGSVSLGTGSGTFSAAKTFTASGGSYNIRFADFNNDGIVDLLNANGGNAYVQLGKGDGTFGSSTYSFSRIGNGYVVGDFNRDGKQDILYNDWFASGMRLLSGNGDGTFTDQGIAATVTTTVQDLLDGSSGFERTASGDFNGDGKLDFMRASATAGLEIFTGNGAGAFSGVQTIGGGFYNLSIVDFNNDGRVDLLCNDGSANAVVYIGQGDGTFASPITMAGSGEVRPDLVADFNEDGYQDFATITGNVYLNDKSGNFSKVSSGLTAARGAGDINRDGHIEMVSLGASSTSFFSPTLTKVFDETKVSISTQAGAQTTLNILDNALQALAAQRANIGAQTNRMDYAVSNNSLTVESISQARSQIEDADIAAETAELVKFQILQQAQVAVLSQANQSLQMVLQLLRPIA